MAVWKPVPQPASSARPRGAPGRRRELGAHEAVEHAVEVLVPGLEIVVGCGHRVEEGSRPGRHGASVANRGGPVRGGAHARAEQERGRPAMPPGRDGAARRADAADGARGSVRPGGRSLRGLRPPSRWPLRVPMRLVVDAAAGGTVGRLLGAHARVRLPGPAARRGLPDVAAHDRRRVPDRPRARRLPGERGTRAARDLARRARATST